MASTVAGERKEGKAQRNGKNTISMGQRREAVRQRSPRVEGGKYFCMYVGDARM
jgi:hypothetical protein